MDKDKSHIELAILSAVQKLNAMRARPLTFGQIYMELVQSYPEIPSIVECVMTVDGLVAVGLVISEKVLEPDPGFPFTQHIIAGLTEIGEAALKACLGESDSRSQDKQRRIHPFG